VTRPSLSETPASGDVLKLEVLKSEVFNAAVLQAQLTTLRIGRKIMVVDETGSTNQDVMQQAGAGAAEGLVLFANQQHRGKGRMGRVWHTVPESLAASVLLRPDLPPQQLPQLSLLTAVALHDVLRTYAPDLRIKWPNDLLFHGAKVAGILTEMRTELGHAHAVVLGFGINVQAPADGWPDDITQAVTDLATISAQRVSKIEIAVAVLQALDQWYDMYLKHGFAPVRAAWWRAHAASGEVVRVHHGQGYIEGIAIALADDGALMLQTASGMQRILAGDLELL